MKKRVLMVVLVLVMGMMLTSCGKSNSSKWTGDEKTIVSAVEGSGELYYMGFELDGKSATKSSLEVKELTMESPESAITTGEITVKLDNGDKYINTFECKARILSNGAWGIGVIDTTGDWVKK